MVSLTGRVLPTLAALCALAATRPAHAWVSPAPDIVVYCTPGLRPAVQALAARYHAARDIPVHIFTASTSGLAGLIRHRARDDVVIADAATLDAMAQDHLIAPTPRATLGLDSFVLVAKPHTIPPNQTPATLARTHTLVLTDPTTAASFTGADILPPGPQATPRIGVADTPDVLFTVLRAPAAIGLVQSSEVRTRADLAIVATLPAPPQRIEAALVTNGQSGNAPDFLAYIASPAAQSLLRTQGLEPAA